MRKKSINGTVKLSSTSVDFLNKYIRNNKLKTNALSVSVIALGLSDILLVHAIKELNSDIEKLKK